MHILITVFFYAPLGGLQNNILATTSTLLKHEHQVTILSKPGPFQDRASNMGANTITTDFSSTADDVKMVLMQEEGLYDLVHAHPFAARQVGIQVAQKLNIPLIVTFHGMYLDGLPDYMDKVSMIFAVSQAVMDFLKSSLNRENSQNEKFMVIPNGVDCDFFRPISVNTGDEDCLTIGLFTRLDRDKRFIIQLFYQALKMTADKYEQKVKWLIVGDGKLAKSVKKEVNQLIDSREIDINFTGWQTDSNLVSAYQSCDIILAPGLCALEGMACGKPVIAVGSKCYIGIIDRTNWLKGVYTNFGGVKGDEYKQEQIERDLQRLINGPELRGRLAQVGIKLAHQFFNSTVINEKIVEIYQMLIDFQD